MSIKYELSEDSHLLYEVIKNSQQFLKIVTFRFFSRDFATALIERANNHVDVEVITTPADNVAKEELRPEIEGMYAMLNIKGVKILPCPWEAGEPRLTPTSVSGTQTGGMGEKWYSVHLQLIVNEKQALITSKNLTSDKNLDIYFLNSSPDFVKLALEKIETIKEICFRQVKVHGITIEGKAVEFLDEGTLKETIDLFKQTKRLKIEHYYVKKLPDATLNKGIYVCPFEGRLRGFLYEFIDSSKSSLYFFLETFFDEDVVYKLQDKIRANPKMDIRIITRSPEEIKQNRQKARNYISQVLSSDIEVSYLPNIQAKFWVSDRWLAIPSGDFNKINLGSKDGKDLWKEDTQLILLDDNQCQIKEFKELFLHYFEPIDIGSVHMKDVTSLFARLTRPQRMKSSDEAKNYIARLKSSLIIRTEKDVEYVMNLAIMLARKHGKRKVEGIFALMAIILYYLQRREQKSEEIVERLEDITDENNTKEAIARLVYLDFVVKSEDVYRVNVKKLVDV
jgi:hypothetical protein